MIYLYVETDCKECDEVKDYLLEKGVEFEERNVDKKPEWQEIVRDLGYLTYPVIVKEFPKDSPHGVVRTSMCGKNLPSLDVLIDYLEHVDYEYS